jgi:hypothetical protein
MNWRNLTFRLRDWSRLHQILTTRFVDAGNLPDSFAWPIEPALV